VPPTHALWRNHAVRRRRSLFIDSIWEAISVLIGGNGHGAAVAKRNISDETP
jgi:hypothetical protein